MSEPAGLAAEMAALISALQTDALALVATAPMEALRLVLLASEMRLSNAARCRGGKVRA